MKSRLGPLLQGTLGRIWSRGPRCSHLDQVHDVHPLTMGCAECLVARTRWVHLRLCLSCGHVGCCEESPGRHARAHFVETGHAVMRSNEPDEKWTWCWIDEVELWDATR